MSISQGAATTSQLLHSQLHGLRQNRQEARQERAARPPPEEGPHGEAGQVRLRPSHRRDWCRSHRRGFGGKMMISLPLRNT